MTIMRKQLACTSVNAIKASAMAYLDLLQILQTRIKNEGSVPLSEVHESMKTFPLGALYMLDTTAERIGLRGMLEEKKFDMCWVQRGDDVMLTSMSNARQILKKEAFNQTCIKWGGVVGATLCVVLLLASMSTSFIIAADGKKELEKTPINMLDPAGPTFSEDTSIKVVLDQLCKNNFDILLKFGLIVFLGKMVWARFSTHQNNSGKESSFLRPVVTSKLEEFEGPVSLTPSMQLDCLPHLVPGQIRKVSQVTNADDLETAFDIDGKIPNLSPIIFSYRSIKPHPKLQSRLCELEKQSNPLDHAVRFNVTGVESEFKSDLMKHFDSLGMVGMNEQFECLSCWASQLYKKWNSFLGAILKEAKSFSTDGGVLNKEDLDAHFVWENLKMENPLILQGEPGTGKTDTLRAMFTFIQDRFNQAANDKEITFYQLPDGSVKAAVRSNGKKQMELDRLYYSTERLIKNSYLFILGLMFVSSMSINPFALFALLNDRAESFDDRRNNSGFSCTPLPEHENCPMISHSEHRVSAMVVDPLVKRWFDSIIMMLLVGNVVSFDTNGVRIIDAFGIDHASKQDALNNSESKYNEPAYVIHAPTHLTDPELGSFVSETGSDGDFLRNRRAVSVVAPSNDRLTFKEGLDVLFFHGDRSHSVKLIEQLEALIAKEVAKINTFSGNLMSSKWKKITLNSELTRELINSFQSRESGEELELSQVRTPPRRRSVPGRVHSPDIYGIRRSKLASEEPQGDEFCEISSKRYVVHRDSIMKIRIRLFQLASAKDHFPLSGDENV